MKRKLNFPSVSHFFCVFLNEALGKLQIEIIIEIYAYNGERRQQDSHEVGKLIRSAL